MVLERIIGVSLIRNKPDVALFIGFMFVLVGFATSYAIFRTGMSVAMIGFSCFLILPYILKIFKPESPQYESVLGKKNKNMWFFIYLFAGMTFAYTILFGILPPSVLPTAFATQIEVVSGAGSAVAGEFIFSTDFFVQIVANNLMIAVIALLLSFVYGSGAIFILNYNASIAGIVYGSSLHVMIWGGMSGIPLYSAPLFYIPHTILEVLGYLFVAVAGLILAKPITQGNERLIKRDIIILSAAAFALIIVGGIVEVYVLENILPFYV